MKRSTWENSDINLFFITLLCHVDCDGFHLRKPAVDQSASQTHSTWRVHHPGPCTVRHLAEATELGRLQRYHSLPISTFKRARVTAAGNWKTLYDQAGLVLIFPGKKIAGSPKRWVKTGIEFYNGRLCVSVVTADIWADWSLLPLSAADEAQGKTTVEVEREEEDGNWSSELKVFLVDAERGRMPIREITWVFHDLDESEEMWVGMFAAKPTEDDRDWLEVKLSNFELETRD